MAYICPKTLQDDDEEGMPEGEEDDDDDDEMMSEDDDIIDEEILDDVDREDEDAGDGAALGVQRLQVCALPAAIMHMRFFNAARVHLLRS